MSPNKITGLIIGAGLSQRMGQLKPLISYNKKPFLAHIILKLNLICQEIVIVTGHKSEFVKDDIIGWLESNCRDMIDKITWSYNPDFESGMLTSLQKGLLEIEDSDWVLYHFVDQPNIPNLFYEQFEKQIDNAYDWIQPKYDGQSGHPILISRKLINKILKLETTQSLRDISGNEKLKSKRWECEFPEVLHDFDTPQQLGELSEKK